MAFQAGLYDEKIVYYGLYFRRPSGAKFFAELGSNDGFVLDRSVTKDALVRVVQAGGRELRDCGDRIELDSGVSMTFDEGALDSIQVGSPRSRRLDEDKAGRGAMEERSEKMLPYSSGDSSILMTVDIGETLRAAVAVPSGVKLSMKAIEFLRSYLPEALFDWDDWAGEEWS